MSDFTLIEQVLMGLMVFALMFAVGCSLCFDDFTKTLAKPKSFIVGLLAQFIIMPAVAYVIYKIFNLPPKLGMALILVSCAPGGSTSNLFSFFARANVVLSVCLTITTTFLAPLIMPILVTIYWGLNKDFSNDAIQIPVLKMIGTLFAALFPIFLGMLVRYKFESKASIIEKWVSRFGHLMILIMICVWIPKLTGSTNVRDIKTYIAIYLVCFIGMAAGNLISRLTKLPKEDRRCVSLEVGIQNAPLAFAIMGISFGSEILETAGWVCLVYGAFSFSNAVNFTVFYRWRDGKIL